MNAISDIFDALGGPTAVARALRIKPSTASEMKRRGSIPAEYWTELTVIAEKHRHPEINAALLARLHARPGGAGCDRSRPAHDPSSAPASHDAGGAQLAHFGRFKHLRRNTFRTSEEITDHIRALREEWDRR